MANKTFPTFDVQQMRKILRDCVDSTPEKVSTFFKTGPGEYAEHDQFIGITVPKVRKIAQEFSFVPLKDLGVLIKSPVNEERLLALIILVNRYQKSSKQEKEDSYQFYLSNLGYVNNWNLVDSSAHLIMGAHLFDRDRAILKDLAVSKTLWDRRIAIVATWYFIRKSDLEWTFQLAELLQNDSEDLIHKAVGWMLREAGKKDQAKLIAFLSTRAHQMPKTMYRYATERLSKEQRAPCF